MGDAQGSRVGVDAVGDHAIKDRPASRNLVTRQQTHDARVTMVELPKEREEELLNANRPCRLRPLLPGDAAAASTQPCLAVFSETPLQGPVQNTPLRISIDGEQERKHQKQCQHRANALDYSPATWH